MLFNSGNLFYKVKRWKQSQVENDSFQIISRQGSVEAVELFFTFFPRRLPVLLQAPLHGGKLQSCPNTSRLLPARFSEMQLIFNAYDRGKQ